MLSRLSSDPYQRTGILLTKPTKLPHAFGRRK